MTATTFVPRASPSGSCRASPRCRTSSETPYPAFIAGIVAHASLPAILVKLSDNEDNADPERLAKLDEATRARLLAKYEPSMASLRAAACAKGWQDRG